MTEDRRDVQVEVLRTAEIPTPYHYIFRAQRRRITQLRAGLSKKGSMLHSPCLAYVVRHAHDPDARRQLTDATQAAQPAR